MTQTTCVTPEDVVAAFGRGERFPTGSEQFEIFSPFIGQLVEIVGSDHLDDAVGLGNLCDVTARFVRALADNSDFVESAGNPMVAMLYRSLADQVEAIAENPEAILAQMGISEVEAMEMEQLGLNEAAKELLHRGELTFSALLTTSPDVFFPKA